MRLDKLLLDLRPRPNAQALDLGMTLLRFDARAVYMAWLALWLPLTALCASLAFFFPDKAGFCVLFAWWLRPLLERAPLYMLSRQVFGEAVTWRLALRAWPSQLGGGAWRLLTWWRPFMPGRGLFQPVWQLEHARAAVAAERRAVIGRNGPARAAFWFGLVCASFEIVLDVGALAFIGLFLSPDASVNPFAIFNVDSRMSDPGLRCALLVLAYGFGAGVVGPLYTACCFTLYLNRRATLEAWDLEIMLRQMTPPSERARHPAASVLLALALPALLMAALLPAPPAQAAPPPAAPCAPAVPSAPLRAGRSPDHDAAQTAVRDEVARLYAEPDLRGYSCVDSWALKDPAKQDHAKPSEKTRRSRVAPPSDWAPARLADLLKVLLIGAALAALGWLLYRQRDALRALARRRESAPPAPTEIAGLDIRPDSLPASVADAVLASWAAGRRRAALALLYRATLSRLVEQDRLPLEAGATEGDCLRLARQSLGAPRQAAVATATALWLNGAYGERWPDEAGLRACCAAWQAEFDGPRTARP